MTNAEFERFLELSIKNFGHKYIDYSDEWNIPFEFSVRFERKMDKLIKRQKKPYFALVCTAGRRAACIVAAIIIAGSAAMSVKAIREWVIDFVVEHFLNNDKVSTIVDYEMPYPKVIEQEYVIDVPTEFVLDEAESFRINNCIQTKYVNKNRHIIFYQYTLYNFNMHIDNEKNKIEYYTDENGILYTIYYFKDNQENCCIYWENKGYAFVFEGNLDKNTALNLCIATKTK